MQPLSVAGDYNIPERLTLTLGYRILFGLSIFLPTIIFALSLSNLGTASYYTSPIASILTAAHAAVLWLLCLRETRRAPSYAGRQRRMPTTRRAAVLSTIALVVVWAAVFVILVTKIIQEEQRDALAASPSPHRGNRNQRHGKALAIVEAVVVGIQGSVTLVMGVQCYHDRGRALRPTAGSGEARNWESSRWLRMLRRR